jgi:cell division protein FtsX
VRNQESFSTYTRQFERIGKVTSVLNILQIGLYIIIATFIVSIAIIVYSIIWNFIYYYKDEIYITRLVGGSKLFIYGPFSLQGMMYVGISFIISSSLFLILLSNLQYVFQLSEFSDVYTGNLPLVLLVQAIVFLVVGAGSWFLSSRRYLKNK